MFSSLLILLVLTGCQAGPEQPPSNAPSSMIYFESPGGNGAQWTQSNPLRIAHQPGPSIYGSKYAPIPLAKMSPQPKLVSVSLASPKMLTKKYFPKYMGSLSAKPYKPLYIAKPKFATKPRYTLKPVRFTTFIPVRPYGGGPQKTRKPYSQIQQPAPIQPPTKQRPLDIPRLIDQFGLVSLKPLLNSVVARQQAQPPVQEIQAALLENPYGFSKGNQFFIPLNNQPVSVKSMATFLRQAFQGTDLLSVPPTAVLDSELIQRINGNRQKYGFESASSRSNSKAMGKEYEPSNEIDEDDDEENGDYENVSNSQEDYDSGEQVGIHLLSPDFRALPKSRRWRTATLGSLGYQS